MHPSERAEPTPDTYGVAVPDCAPGDASWAPPPRLGWPQGWQRCAIRSDLLRQLVEHCLDPLPQPARQWFAPLSTAPRPIRHNTQASACAGATWVVAILLILCSLVTMVMRHFSISASLKQLRLSTNRHPRPRKCLLDELLLSSDEWTARGMPSARWRVTSRGHGSKYAIKGSIAAPNPDTGGCGRPHLRRTA